MLEIASKMTTPANIAIQKCALSMYWTAWLNTVVMLCCVSHATCVIERALPAQSFTVRTQSQLHERLQILISLLIKPNMGHCGLIFTIKISNYVISQIQALHMLTRISQQAGMREEGEWKGMMQHQSVHLEFKKISMFVWAKIVGC